MYLSGFLDLSIRASIYVYYGSLQEVCSVVIESVPSPVANLLQLSIQEVEAMGMSSIPGVSVDSFASKFVSNNTRFG